MQTWMRVFFCLLASFALAGSTCTRTYTQADVDAKEVKALKEDKKVEAEVKRDTQIGEQGGVSSEAIDEQIETIDGGSGADF